VDVYHVMHVDEERGIRYQLLLYQHSTRYHDVDEEWDFPEEKGNTA